MKKIMTKFLVVLLAALTFSGSCFAFVRYEDKMEKKLVRQINVTGFTNLPPFGYIITNDVGKKTYQTVFKPLLDHFAKENNLDLSYKTKGTYEELISEVRKGEIDLLLGAYYNTEDYRNMELVYPAILTNPLTVFVLPNRINDIKDVGDLQKLKGVRLANEVYSDFVKEQMKPLNIEVVDTPYELFERLFTKKVDYILISHYQGLIEASKLGLRQQISIAKQAIWSMPIFFAVSKFAKERKMITKQLTAYCKNEELRKQVSDNLQKIVQDIEQANIGVVPPTFGLEKND